MHKMGFFHRDIKPENMLVKGTIHLQSFKLVIKYNKSCRRCGENS